MDVTDFTVANLTPPGYFNLGPNALQSTKDYVQWWNNILSDMAGDSVNLKTLLLTPWLYDYYPTSGPVVPWLQYLLNMYGIGFFTGLNSQAAYLYQLVSSAWSTSTIFNITMILQTLSLPPFSWFTGGNPPITAGNLVPSIMDTGFIIYSTAGSAPATPTPSDYSPRNWDVPAGWANSAASATYYCRGYISGATVVWSAPRPVSDFENAYVFSAAVPVAVPTAGTVAIVYDDSTGDIGSIYYSDGSAWRKNSTPNADLGLVNPGTGTRPDPEAITVWAPDPTTVSYAIDSAIPPQSDGPTEGYGTFASWADTAIFNDQISISVTQIAGGTVALAVLFELLRRIKPVNKTFSIDISGTQYTITDMRQK
jgi:hypothetical protein